MNTIWNHWFWITLGVCAQVLGGDIDQDVDDSLVPLPLGARGGKILSIPPNGGPPFRPPPPPRASFARLRRPLEPRVTSSVSVSKSVSKVSVKMGKISVAEPGLNSLDDISDIYVDRDIGNSVNRRQGLPATPPEFNRNLEVDNNSLDSQEVDPLDAAQDKARRIDPQFIGYNLVYREPPPPPPPMAVRPPATAGILQTIIAKLKSLARATSSGIRFSNLLTGGESMPAVPIHHPPPPPPAIRPAVPGPVVRPQAAVVPLLRIDDLGVMGALEEQPQHQQPVHNQQDLLQGQLIEEQEEEHMREEDAEQILSGEEEAEAVEDLLDSLEVNEVEDNEIEEVPSRSAEARGRSLPLHVLEEIEIESMEAVEKRLKEDEAVISIQEVGSEEWDQKEDMATNEEDFAEFTGNGLDPVSSSYRIEMERLGTANISAIVGVIVGIIIFIIISLVLIFLAIQRGRSRGKKAGPAEDQISQASYMTYSTTISDHSVHYGPNWDKEIVDDLCSLDNDSFLNSLEAVATTDYWVDCKY